MSLPVSPQHRSCRDLPGKYVMADMNSAGAHENEAGTGVSEETLPSCWYNNITLKTTIHSEKIDERGRRSPTPILYINLTPTQTADDGRGRKRKRTVTTRERSKTPLIHPAFRRCKKVHVQSSRKENSDRSSSPMSSAQLPIPTVPRYSSVARPSVLSAPAFLLDDTADVTFWFPDGDTLAGGKELVEGKISPRATELPDGPSARDARIASKSPINEVSASFNTIRALVFSLVETRRITSCCRGWGTLYAAKATLLLS